MTIEEVFKEHTNTIPILDPEWQDKVERGLSDSSRALLECTDLSSSVVASIFRQCVSGAVNDRMFDAMFKDKMKDEALIRSLKARYGAD